MAALLVFGILGLVAGSILLILAAIRRKGKKVAGLVAGVSVLLVIAGAVLAGGGDKPATSAEPKVGDKADIRVTFSGPIWLAVDKDAYDQLLKASMAKDYFGMNELANKGKIFDVENRTKVLVIDRSFGIRQVRILEGPRVGLFGWLPMEWVKLTE